MIHKQQIINKNRSKSIKLFMLITFIITGFLIQNSPLKAEEKTTIPADFQIAAGFSSIFATAFDFNGIIPTFIAVRASVDIKKLLRLEADYKYHITGMHGPGAVHHVSIGAGAAFRPVGKNAAKNGGFQLKIPVVFNLGYLTGDAEVYESDSDTLRWVTFGIYSGLDCIWYFKKPSFGFFFTFGTTANARVDAGTTFYYDYGTDDYAHIFADATLLFGIIF